MSTRLYQVRTCHVGFCPTYILMGCIGCQQLVLCGGTWPRARSMACPCWNVPTHACIDKGVAADQRHVLTDTAIRRARNSKEAGGHQKEAVCWSVPILGRWQKTARRTPKGQEVFSPFRVSECNLPSPPI